MSPFNAYDDQYILENFPIYGRHWTGLFMGRKSREVAQRAYELGIKRGGWKKRFITGVTMSTGDHTPYRSGTREYWRGRCLWYISQLKKGIDYRRVYE